MTEIDLKPFRIREGERVSLAERPTEAPPCYDSKSDYDQILARHIEELSDLQQLHYAANRHALLLVFQAMDAAGKDGAIRHVMSGINPQGCQVFSFKQPSATELEHDFLWRAAVCLPERGRIGIFNRSYYEEVLVVRVHPELLRAEAAPDPADGPKLWEERFESIRGFEAHLGRNGTKVAKIFLHVSKAEQRKRFLSRIDEPEKNWKFSLGDITERKYWDDYMRAYEACLSATSTDQAPWYVVPADDKKNARLIVSEIVLTALRDLRPTFPQVTPERRRELALIREQLEAEKD